jgi:hypothetical protein
MAEEFGGKDRREWGEIHPVEWRWVLLTAWIILLLSSLPYLAGYAASTPQQVFNGAVIDRQDYAVHLATMHLGARGEWAYRMRFTAEPQQGAYVKLGYLFLGHIARLLGTSLPVTYHFGRLVFSTLACLAIYALAAQAFTEIFWRRIAFLLAIFGSGLGWLQLLAGWLPQADISPIDFWLIDGYVFLGILALPHFSAVTALLAGMVLCGITYLRKPTWTKWILACLAALLVQTLQPYAPVLADIALLGAFISSWVLARQIRRHEVLFLLGLGLVQLPLLVYNAAAMNSDPLWQSFVRQNVTLSPPPVYYLWGYAILWPFALLGAAGVFRSLRQAEPASRLRLPVLAAALAWVAAALLLAYTPFNLQRRFMHAFSLPLALLAAAGLRDMLVPWLARRFPAGFRRRSALAVILLTALASLSSLLVCLGNVLYLSTQPAALFDSGDLVRSVDWISARAGPDDLVLSAELSGQLVAARSGLPVFLGHPIETLEYPEKTQHVAELFNGSSAGEWLVDAGVKWVIYRREDGKPGNEISPQAPLEAVYQDGAITVYQVRQ